MNWQHQENYQLQRPKNTVQDQLATIRNLKRGNSSLQQAQSIYINSSKIKTKYRKLKTEESQNLNNSNGNSFSRIKFKMHSNNQEFGRTSKQEIEEAFGSMFKKRKLKIDIANWKDKSNKQKKALEESSKSLEKSNKSIDRQTIRIHQIKYTKYSKRYATIESQNQHSENFQRRNINESSQPNDTKQLKKINLKSFLPQTKNKSQLKLMPLPLVKKQIDNFRLRLQAIKKITEEQISDLNCIQYDQLKKRMQNSASNIVFRYFRKKVRERTKEAFRRLLA